MNTPAGESEMWRLERNLLKPGFTCAYTPILTTVLRFWTTLTPTIHRLTTGTASFLLS